VIIMTMMRLPAPGSDGSPAGRGGPGAACPSHSLRLGLSESDTQSVTGRLQSRIRLRKTHSKTHSDGIGPAADLQNIIV
jgi:hypothetical protein